MSVINSLIGAGLLWGILLGFVFALIIFGISSSRTKGYRKDLTNLYVASKIRSLAQRDGLNLSEEYETYKSWLKKRRMEDKNLDDTIEEDLKEQLQVPNHSKK